MASPSAHAGRVDDDVQLAAVVCVVPALICVSLWSLGRAGFVVNVIALAYGIFAMVLLIEPAPGTETFLDRWIVAIGLAIVAGTGLLYLVLTRPDRRSEHVPEGDARVVAHQLQHIRRDARVR